MRIETHVHTKYSKDSLLCFWPLYLKCRIKKIDCIAITEHNNIEGGLKFKHFCERREDKVAVIVGEEVFTDSGEIIGLYLNREIAPGLTPGETIKQIKDQGGVVYVPHPYDEKRKNTVLKESSIKEYVGFIDCIEIHNGRNISKIYDAEQLKISKKYGIQSVIGSDAHTLIEIGRNYMEFDDDKVPSNADEFIKLLNSARIQKKECILFTHKITIIVKLAKMLARGDFNGIYHYVNGRFKRRVL